MLSVRIDEEFKASLKAKNTVKVETLRMLKAAITHYLIEKRKQTVDDSEIISLIQKQVKLRQDAIEGFKKGGRQDLVEKETLEKSILEAYLPAGLSDQELKQIVQKAIQQTSAKTKSDLGKVMKEVMIQAKGRADGRKVNELATQLLNG